MKRKFKLLGLALGATTLLALSLGGAVFAADGWDAGANYGNCRGNGSAFEGAACPGLNSDGSTDLGTCPRWSEEADSSCVNEDGTYAGCGYTNEGDETARGGCWRGGR